VVRIGGGGGGMGIEEGIGWNGNGNWRRGPVSDWNRGLESWFFYDESCVGIKKNGG